MVSSLITLIVGVLGIVLGLVVKKYKMGYLVRGIDIRKYDNDKVADIMGGHTMILGICLVAIAGVIYVLDGAYENITAITIAICCLAIEIGGYSRIKKYAKLDN